MRSPRLIHNTKSRQPLRKQQLAGLNLLGLLRQHTDCKRSTSSIIRLGGLESGLRGLTGRGGAGGWSAWLWRSTLGQPRGPNL